VHLPRIPGWGRKEHLRHTAKERVPSQFDDRPLDEPEQEGLMRVSKAATRGVLAVSIVMVLAMPAQAKPRDAGRWFERKIDPIVKIVKKVMTSLGDGLIDPWP
jgi:hypothetical protein